MRVKKIGDFLNPERNPDPTNNAGGVLKRPCKVERRLGWRHHIEYQRLNSLHGKDMVNLAYELRKNFDRNNPIVIRPGQYNSLPELFNAVNNHAKRWQRLSDGTIDHRLRCARRMARHPVFPINFFNLDYNQFIAYMQYREDYEGANHFALKNDLQAIQLFLRAYGIDLRSWFYRLPPVSRRTEKILPLPDVVHTLINHKFSKEPYLNALFQYLHAHNFWIGWRVPSEPCLMKMSDIDFESESIVITEQKKHYRTRQIFPDLAIVSGNTRKSFRNWIDKWRPKVENQYSKDYLYLQLNGKPFTIRYLGKISK
jgi:integrase